MLRTFALLALALLECSAVSASDLFLVIGQSNTRGRAQEAWTQTLPSEAEEWDQSFGVFRPLADQTGLPFSTSTDQPNWTSDRTGPIPAFATQWAARNPGRRQMYVVRAIGGTRLHTDGAIVTPDFGAWGPGSANLSRASSALVSAYRKAVELEKNPDRIIVIWGQGENDAAGRLEGGADLSVSKDEYIAAFESMIWSLDSDLRREIGKGITAVGLIQTGYFWGFTYPQARPYDTLLMHRDRVEQIATAQSEIGAAFNAYRFPQAALVSNKARYLMSPCINAAGNSTPAGAVGCRSHDFIHYNLYAQSVIGRESADNLHTFLVTGVRPLDPSASFNGGVSARAARPIFRWVRSFPGQTTPYAADHMVSFISSGLDGIPNTQFRGVRYFLHDNPASDRVALWTKETTVLSSTGEYLTEQSVTLTPPPVRPGKGRMPVPLGYCYTSSGNNRAPILALFNGFNQVTTVDPQEAEKLREQGYSDQGILCYTD